MAPGKGFEPQLEQENVVKLDLTKKRRKNSELDRANRLKRSQKFYAD